MSRLIIFFFLILLFKNNYSQGVNNLWLTGYNSLDGIPWGGSIINFSGGNADTSYQFREMNFRETNASICNDQGNLLFYTNGVYIANSIGDTMMNGNGLNPGTYVNNFSYSGLKISQADIILPYPGDSSKYYLIHETLEYTNPLTHTYQLLATIIDMNLDNGKGAVIQKNITLLQDTLLENGLTACKHANGRDWWLLCHKWNSDIWYTLLITPTGITGPFIQHQGPVMSLEYEGQTAFSPNGSKYARCLPLNGLDIYDFDRCTGILSNNIHVTFNDTAYTSGLAFSSNSDLLYVNFPIVLYQFDLTSPNIAASIDTVGIFDYFADPFPPLYTNFYLSQLAPDSKIYIGTGTSTRYFHVINNPNVIGIACDFQQHSFYLPTKNAFTIPNHPNYFLGSEGGTICDSLPTAIQQEKNLSFNFIAYPNPVWENKITFSYRTLVEEGNVSIYDIEGKQVSNYKLPQWSSVQQIQLPKLLPGIYLAKLTSHNDQADFTFIVE